MNSRIIIDDPSISNHHLRIFSTIYDADEEPVQGFVYAEDMSTNGSYLRYRRGDTWAESSIGKGNAVLLGDQDQIRLCDGTVIGFDAVASTMPTGQSEEVNHIQEQEQEVGCNSTQWRSC
jgi:pSer/pThr/pTyr-binding forkhead associated (FHA) protein